MSVEIEPSELGFQRPFNREVAQILRLHNTTDLPVAFKVKTTAPKQYCVRPNSGRIEAGNNVEVQVLLQAMKEDPPLDTRCRDKFLVLSVPITEDVASPNVQQIWQNVDQTSGKKGTYEKKIRVNFLPPEVPSAPQAAAETPAHDRLPATNGDIQAVSNQVTPPYPSPVGDSTLYGSPTQDRAESIAESHRSGESRSFHDEKKTNSNEELKAQLAEAQAEIKRLAQQVQENTLRQRKAGADIREPERRQSNVATLQQQPVGEGVPVQIVAALCLLSFLLAYFFF